MQRVQAGLRSGSLGHQTSPGGKLVSRRHHYYRNVCRNSTHDGSQRFIVCLEAGGEETRRLYRSLGVEKE